MQKFLFAERICFSKRQGISRNWNSSTSGAARALELAEWFAEAPPFGGRIDDVAAAVTERVADRWRVVFASDQSERLHDLLADRDIYPRITKRGAVASEPPSIGSVEVVHASLGAGFSVPNERPSPFLFSIPALALLAGLVWVQRRRRVPVPKRAPAVQPS